MGVGLGESAPQFHFDQLVLLICAGGIWQASKGEVGYNGQAVKAALATTSATLGLTACVPRRFPRGIYNAKRIHTEQTRGSLRRDQGERGSSASSSHGTCAICRLADLRIVICGTHSIHSPEDIEPSSDGSLSRLQILDCTSPTGA